MYYEMNVCKHALKWLIGADKKTMNYSHIIELCECEFLLRTQKKKEGIIMNEWEERNKNKKKQKDEYKVNKK